MTIKCPYCNFETENMDEIIPNTAQHNILVYGTNLLLASLCCEKPLLLKREQIITIENIVTNRESDDWGHKFSK